MIYYTYLYLILTLIGFGFYLGKEKNPEKLIGHVFHIISILPFLGRTLGWW